MPDESIWGEAELSERDAVPVAAETGDVAKDREARHGVHPPGPGVQIPSASRSESSEAGTSGGIPESQTTEAISAPATKIGSGSPLDRARPSGRQISHSRESMRTRSGDNASIAPRTGSAARKCLAFAPAGTTCKLCGKVHPALAGASVHIEADGDVQPDFKKGKVPK